MSQVDVPMTLMNTPGSTPPPTAPCARHSGHRHREPGRQMQVFCPFGISFPNSLSLVHVSVPNVFFDSDQFRMKLSQELIGG